MGRFLIVSRMERSKWRRGLLPGIGGATTADEEPYWALFANCTVLQAADLVSPMRSCNGY